MEFIVVRTCHFTSAFMEYRAAKYDGTEIADRRISDCWPVENNDSTETLALQLSSTLLLAAPVASSLWRSLRRQVAALCLTLPVSGWIDPELVGQELEEANEAHLRYPWLIVT